MSESFKKAMMHGNTESQPHTAEEESMENKELFRATVGFDFVFDKNGTPYCVEINGNNSGIEGMRNLKDKHMDSTMRIMANIRANRNNKSRGAIKTYNNALGDAHKDTYGNITKKSDIINLSFLRTAIKEPIFKNANKNHQILQEILDNKSLQTEFIPKQGRPKYYSMYEIATLEDNKLYIVKKNDSARGKGVHILYGWQIKDKADTTRIENILIQDFIEPADAENGPPDHPASLRLLIDFRVTEKNGVEPMYITGYQRVSEYTSDNIDADIASRDDVYIINKSTGADSYTMSENELKAIMPLALGVLNNLTDYMKHNLKHTESDAIMAM